MYLMLRHGTKQYKNGESDIYPFDPDLTYKGRELIAKITHQFIEEYGEPDLIYCSPYLRTRHTAKIVRSQCVNKPDIIIDRDLSEFLGAQDELREEDVRPETWKYDPYPPETREEFTLRAKNIYTKLFNRDDDCQDLKIVIVTHSYTIIKMISYHNSISSENSVNMYNEYGLASHIIYI